MKTGRNAGIALLLIAPLWTLLSNWSDADLSGEYDAIRYGTEAFNSFEPDALAIEIRYERAFTLWYYREVELVNERDDVAVIYLEHATFDWGLELLKRKYPDLVLPDEPLTGGRNDADTAAWIIRNNIDKRPVYIGATVNSLAEEGYRFEAVGLLYRVFPPE